MSNVMDILLKSDIDKIKLPIKQVKIKSLSEIFGEDIVFTIQAIQVKKYNEIQESGIKISEDGELGEIDSNKIQILTIIESVKEPNLKSKELMEHFKVHSPTELIEKLFAGKPGEVLKLYNSINELCGYGKGAVEEIKNL